MVTAFKNVRKIIALKMACFPSLIIYVECPPLAIVNGDTMPSVWTFLTTLNTIYEWETVLKVSNTFQKKKKKMIREFMVHSLSLCQQSMRWKFRPFKLHAFSNLVGVRKGTVSSLHVALKSKSERAYQAVTKWPNE